MISDRMVERIFKFKVILIENKGNQINFWKDRSFFNKLCRIMYRMFRCFYVCFIFYFNPFLVLLVYNVTTSFNKINPKWLKNKEEVE